MIITICIIILLIASCFFGFILGFSIGYGEGYEAHMLEDMDDEEKDSYFKNKYIMTSIANKHQL